MTSHLIVFQGLQKGVRVNGSLFCFELRHGRLDAWLNGYTERTLRAKASVSYRRGLSSSYAPLPLRSFVGSDHPSIA